VRGPWSSKPRMLPGGDRETADRLYAGGGWDVLRSLRERARYSQIAGYCAALEARRVLDVGCGEGLLAERLQRPPLERYLGVEISPVAVEIARGKDLEACAFEVGDALCYAPEGEFDAIIFNEILYYFPQPEAVVSRMARNLAPDGAVIVSIHRRPRYRWVWRRLEAQFTVADAVELRHASGVAWDVRLLRPRA
jgi:2-polyprenyl-3-methyl-5-hydroxy-6-metoxy-1,4-benzoquinol methylase